MTAATTASTAEASIRHTEALKSLSCPEPVKPTKIVSPFQATGGKVHVLVVIVLASLCGAVVVGLVGTILCAPFAACLLSAKILAIGAIASSSTGFIAGIAVISYVLSRLYNEKNAPKWESKEVEIKQEIEIKEFNVLGGVVLADEVRLTENAEDTTKEKIALIDKAEYSIEMSLSYGGGKPLQDTLAAIQKRLGEKKELRVRLIMCSELLEKADYKKIREIEKAHPNNFHCLITDVKSRVSKEGLHTIENHVKILVVDGQHIVVGGTNLHTNLCRGSVPPSGPGTTCSEKLQLMFWTGGACDMDAIIRGRRVGDLYRREFYENWKQWAHQVKPADRPKGVVDYYPLATHPDLSPVSTPPIPVRVLSSSFGRDSNPIVDERIRLIQAATKTIDIANMSLNLQRRELEALVEAANRGVIIRIITNGTEKGSPTSNKLFARAQDCFNLILKTGRLDASRKIKFTVLLEASANSHVTIHNFTQKDVMFHEKVMSIDGEHVLVTNSNIGRKSDLIDSEFGMYARSQVCAKQLKAHFDLNIAKSKEVTLKEAYDNHNSLLGRLQSSPRLVLAS